MRGTCGWLWCLAIGGMMCSLAAGARPSLDRGVPDDVHVVVQRWRNPERAFIREHWLTVWNALKRSGIDKELKTIISREGPREGGQEIVETWEEVMALLGGVDWAGLAGGDCTVMLRIGPAFPEVLAVCKGDAEKVADNMTGLRAILEALAEWSDAVQLRETTVGASTKVTELTVEEAPVSLLLGRQGSLILVGNSKTLMAEYVELEAAEASSTVWSTRSGSRRRWPGFRRRRIR